MRAGGERLVDRHTRGSAPGDQGQEEPREAELAGAGYVAAGEASSHDAQDTAGGPLRPGTIGPAERGAGGWPAGRLAVRHGVAIVAGMLTFRADKWLRIGAGLGLVLLLAAQEKVWPWALRAAPAESDVEPRQPQPAPPTDPASSSDAEKKPTKVLLPHLVPDATVPRWAVARDLTLRSTAPGARDGVVARGPRDTIHGPAVAPRPFNTPTWYIFQLCVGATTVVPFHDDISLWSEPQRDRTVQPLGPPIA